MAERIRGGIYLADWAEMPVDWRLTLLGDHCQIRRGSSPRPAGDPRYFGGSIPWFKIGDATKRGDRFIDETEETVTDLGAANSVLIPADSLIVANSGVSLGFAVRTKRPGCIHDGWLLFEQFHGLDKHYLLYQINFMTQLLRVMADGTTQPNLNTNIARQLVIPLPPLAEQKAIAHILGTLDDKIELNRKMNETLEAMARALFKSWFVDFDPVRKKQAGQATGLPAEIDALFPGEFEDSALGEVPKGWRVGKLGDVTRLNPESWTKQNYPMRIKYVDLANTKWGNIEEASELEKADAPSRAQRVLRPRDTIVGTVRPGNGSYSYILEEGLTGSTGFAVLRPMEPYYSEFVYLAATSSETIETLAHLADGGAYPAVRPEVVQNVEVVMPDARVFGAFSNKVQNLLASIQKQKKQNKYLQQLRDTLLPKLISGELRVSALSSPEGRIEDKVAERFVGA